jgi:hypothetical protein
LLSERPGIDQFAVWFPNWVPRLLFEVPFEVLVPLCLALVGLILYFKLRKSIKTPTSVMSGWLLLLPVVPSVVAWLTVAPEPRYAMYLFWALAGVCCAQAVVVASLKTGMQQLNRKLVGIGALIAISPAVVNPLMAHDGNPLKAIVSENLNHVPVGSDTTAIRVPKLTTFITTSGLELYVPVSALGQCFDAPLPCTPNPAPNVRLREPGNLASGFVVDGEWQMQRWPYDWHPHFLEAWRSLRRKENERMVQSQQ